MNVCIRQSQKMHNKTIYINKYINLRNISS